MPRPRRVLPDGALHHVLNRGNRRETVFHKPRRRLLGTPHGEGVRSRIDPQKPCAAPRVRRGSGRRFNLKTAGTVTLLAGWLAPLFAKNGGSPRYCGRTSAAPRYRHLACRVAGTVIRENGGQPPYWVDVGRAEGRPASRSFQFRSVLKPRKNVPCVCQRQNGRIANDTT
jgi:hypothetical protein